MTEHQAAQLGLNARQVLDNEAYQAGMEAVKAQIVKQLMECPMHDHQEALLLRMLGKVAVKFEYYLSGAIEAGKFADHRINLDAERDESRARKFLRRVAG